jgi:NADH dehydrogenase/NADH:ubiquinone oxidoreductase subunit G
VLGTKNIDNCARLCHSSTVAALQQTLGYGAMTNRINEDIGEADAYLISGSNTTESHPVLATRIKQNVRDGADLLVFDPREVQIAEYAKSENFDIILTGKETIDYNGSALGGMLATMLEWPFISYVAKLDLEGDGKAVMKREIEGGEEELEASLPIVVSAQKGMAEARIPTMRGIMQAKKKPLDVVEPKEGDNLTEIVRYELPPEKGDCKYVDADNPGELVELLHNEAKVI